MQKIISPQNPLVKHLSKLRNSKSYRKEKQSVIILGKKIILELSQFLSIKTLLLEQDIFIPAEKIFYTNREILKKIANIPNPEGAIAEVALPSFQNLSKMSSILILDRITDPGNLGTLIRTAKALNFNGAHLLPGCVDPFNDKAIRAGKGATFTLPLGYGSLDFQGDLFAADMSGTPIDRVEFKKPLALILGSESHGVDPFWLEKAKKISIPMNGQTESLNVATAGAICMYVIGQNL